MNTAQVWEVYSTRLSSFMGKWQYGPHLLCMPFCNKGGAISIFDLRALARAKLMELCTVLNDVLLQGFARIR